jgi:hypothetical protein
MSKKIALLVALAAIVGILAVKTVLFAMTIGELKCIYAPPQYHCTKQPEPIKVPEETNKNQG